MKKTNKNNYDLAAYFYDALAGLYSGFQILACKKYQLDYIKAGDRVLYAGAGGADDAILAAQKGARVTIVELSRNMVKKAKNKIQKSGMTKNIELIHGDIFDFESTPFDVVVANFFLNVFDPHTMEQVFAHMNSLLKDKGLFMIADFSPLQGNLISRFIQQVYYGLALFIFVLVAKNPLHKIYDYSHLFQRLSLEPKNSQNFGLFAKGPKWYRVWIAQKRC